MKAPWKEIVAYLDEHVRSHGVCAARAKPFVPFEEGHLWQPEEAPELSFDGKGLERKKVRQWLYEHRNEKRMKDERVVLLAVYDEEEDTTWVSFGVNVEGAVAERVEAIPLGV